MATLSNQSTIPINWKLCVICQVKTNEPLQCPANSKRSDVGAGYKSLVDNIKLFHDVGEIPLKVDLSKLNDGSGVENSLLQNKASWHKSCRNKFNITEIKRAQKRKACENERRPEESSPCRTRRTSSLHSFKGKSSELRCFFCDEVDSNANLHRASTEVIDKRVKECAVQLKDRNLLAKEIPAAGDMVALEAKYHSRCLASLYNRYRKMANTNSDKASGQEKRLHGIAFAEIISYIEEFFEERNTSSNVPSLRLADLAKMYMTKLEELGVDTSRVNICCTQNTWPY